MRPRELARLVGRPGLPLQATPNDSTDPTICNWHGSGLGVKLVVDEPERRPHQLDHVGDDSAYGGAGAWWTRSKSQLVAYADKRILRIRVTGRDLDDPARQGAAVRTARLTFERLSEPGP
ncbi:MAG: hypothetical protein H0T69_08305 [Thermoleophilaceae bacterium]|nr:hypothetical protein [Thermoleophilaceae bacterium]